MMLGSHPSGRMRLGLLAGALGLQRGCSQSAVNIPDHCRWKAFAKAAKSQYLEQSIGYKT
jgi:hypothetical protein